MRTPAEAGPEVAPALWVSRGGSMCLSRLQVKCAFYLRKLWLDKSAGKRLVERPSEARLHGKWGSDTLERLLGPQISSDTLAQVKGGFSGMFVVPCCHRGITEPKKSQVDGLKMGCISPTVPKPDRFSRPLTCGFAAPLSSVLLETKSKTTSIKTLHLM